MRLGSCLESTIITGKTLFAQLIDLLPWKTFGRIVARYDGDSRVRTLSCDEQYRAMAFAQLTYRESLRDIETCLSVQASKLYHMGFSEPVRRSTLADLCGIGRTADRPGSEALCWRRSRPGTDQHGLCAGFDDHRPVPVGLSVGAFPHDQIGGEAAHSVGFARQYPEFPAYFGWQDGRCPHPRYAEHGAGRHIRHGSRLCRFRPPAYDASGWRVLRDACQIEPEGSSALFGGGGSRDRRRLRPDDCPGRPLRPEGLPGAFAPHPL